MGFTVVAGLEVWLLFALLEALGPRGVFVILLSTFALVAVAGAVTWAWATWRLRR